VQVLQEHLLSEYRAQWRCLKSRSHASVEYRPVALISTYYIHYWGISTAQADVFCKGIHDRIGAAVAQYFANFLPRISNKEKFYLPRFIPNCNQCNDGTAYILQSYEIVWPMFLFIQPNGDFSELDFPPELVIESGASNMEADPVCYKLISRVVHKSKGAGHFMTDTVMKSPTSSSESVTMRYNDMTGKPHGTLQRLGSASEITAALKGTGMTAVEYGYFRASKNAKVGCYSLPGQGQRRSFNCSDHTLY
jgi:hypothetical protein